MKPTENYEQLLARFTKRMDQVGKKKAELDPSFDEWLKVASQLHYLRGCKETVDYLMTGKLPNDGNHDGMKDHVPTMKPKPVRHNNLDALDR